MPLPHLKKENNADQEPFVSVEHEMTRLRGETHPFTPARDIPNPELDNAGSDKDKAASDRS